MKKEHYENLNLKDLDGEIWIDAFGFDGFYQVSSKGRVKTVERLAMTKKGTYFLVKERIRSQKVGKDGRISMTFNIEGKKYPINLPAVIYFSFNRYEQKISTKYCVMHKNKIQHDNRLENLQLTTVTYSHKKNNEYNLLPHLQENNRLKSEKYKILTHKTCKMCNIEKEINEFKGYTCRECVIKEKQKRYFEVNERKRNLKIRVEDLVTKNIYIFKNTTDEDLKKMFSRPTLRKVINELKGNYTPYKNSRYKNPCKITHIK